MSVQYPPAQVACSVQTLCVYSYLCEDLQLPWSVPDLHLDQKDMFPPPAAALFLLHGNHRRLSIHGRKHESALYCSGGHVGGSLHSKRLTCWRREAGSGGASLGVCRGALRRVCSGVCVLECVLRSMSFISNHSSAGGAPDEMLTERRGAAVMFHQHLSRRRR